MKIGISGASGQLGARVVAELLRRAGDDEIVGISRTPEKLAVTARFGDYDQPESLAAAYAGLDRLLIIPSADMTPGRRATQNLAAIDAAVAAGVGHVVLLSSCGTRSADEPAVWASYFAAEQRLMRTAAAWSILRMSYYAESFAQEAARALARGVLAGLAENRVSYVSREDVALAAAGLLASAGHHGAIYHATGPEAWSGAARAAAVAAASGRACAFVTVTGEALAEGMHAAGLPPALVAVALSLQAAFAVGGFDIVTGDVERLSGSAPRALGTVLARSLG